MVQVFLKSLIQFLCGFNSDFINYSWNTSGSQIIYPYFDKSYNNDGSGLTKIKHQMENSYQNAIGAMEQKSH
jgi:hypothetical protein